MNYIYQINAFWKQCELHEINSPTTVAVYFALLHLNNKSGWKPKIRVHPKEVMDLVMLNNTKTYYAHLKRLQDMELISYSPAKNQFHPTFVHLRRLYGDDTMKGKNIPQQSNSNEIPPTQHLPDHQSQNPSISMISDKAKPDKQETDKTQTIKKEVVFDEIKKIYEGFIRQRTRIAFQESQSSLDAFKEIEKKLCSTSKDQNAALRLWQKILHHWDQLTSFYRDQVNPEQINKNLLNILSQLNNANSVDKGRRQYSDRKTFKM